MAELTTGDPLFPGKDQFDQLFIITKLLGNMPNDIKELYLSNREFRGTKLVNIKIPVTLKKKFRKYFGPEELELITGLLEPSPSKRLTA